MTWQRFEDRDLDGNVLRSGWVSMVYGVVRVTDAEIAVAPEQVLDTIVKVRCLELARSISDDLNLTPSLIAAIDGQEVAP